MGECLIKLNGTVRECRLIWSMIQPFRLEISLVACLLARVDQDKSVEHPYTSLKSFPVEWRG